MNLNPEQKLAAQYMDGPALVLAGPGTGKTTTLVGRYQHLLTKGIPAKEILCCTFSKKAADELKFRIETKAIKSSSQLPIGTFHALSVRILRAIGEQIGVPKNFDIWAKDWERKKVVENFLNDLIKKGIYKNVDQQNVDPEIALQFIDDSREALLDPEDASVKATEKGDTAGIAHSDLYRLYEDYLNTENKIDFPRMVQWACKALTQNAAEGGNFAKQFSHILVDEYQDINFAQKTLIDLIVAQGAQLWAVGDDFQAIYGWRGSDLNYLLGFKQQYSTAQIITLTRNYRSGKRIVETANNLSDKMKEKFEKILQPTRDEEGQIVYEHLANANNEGLAIVEEVKERIRLGVPYNQIAILARTNKLPITTVNLLIRNGIPLNLKGGVGTFSEYEARLLLTALASSSEIKLENIWSLRMQPSLSSFSNKLIGEDWSRRVKALTTFIQKRPPKGLTSDEITEREGMLDRYRDYILEFNEASSLFNMLKAIFDAKDDKDSVFVGTIHSAKGLEWDSVIVMGWEDGVLPQKQSLSLKAYEEERRIAYVGITRAKNFLMLTSVEQREERGLSTSSFLAEMFSNEEDVQEAKAIEPVVSIPKDLAKKQFMDRYTITDMSKDDRATWIKQLREARLAVEREASLTPKDTAESVGSGWSDQAAQTGLLTEAGYTVRKGGPNAHKRQAILADILHGRVHIPDWMSSSIQAQWGLPNTQERFTKMRNTISVALGNQKGRNYPSVQAIHKWESDLNFLDNTLHPQLIEELKD